MDKSLETLKELKRTVEHAISIMDIQCLIPMSSHEIYDYKRRFGDFDFIIGDFGVKRIHGREDEMTPNARTQRPGASDAPIATESAPPGSLE